LGTLVLLLLGYFQTSGLCDYDGWCGNFWNIINLLGMFLLLFPPILIFSLITWRFDEKIFDSWIHFSSWWIPLSIFFVLIAPDNQGDWMFPHDKERISLLMAALFVIISVLVITYQTYKLRAKK
jgi:hypothetical protein